MAGAETRRFAILASGRGSNAMRLIQAFQGRGEAPLDAMLCGVLSDQPEAGVLGRAEACGVPTAMVPRLPGMSKADHEAAVWDVLQGWGVEHLLLAGYMRLLSASFLRRCPGVILNIHPSLLPEFPGLNVQEKQWQAGVQVAGATVHFVDEGMDTGPVLLQGSLEVRGDEGAQGLAERILTEVEHVIYPRAVRVLLERLQRGVVTP